MNPLFTPFYFFLYYSLIPAGLISWITTVAKSQKNLLWWIKLAVGLIFAFLLLVPYKYPDVNSLFELSALTPRVIFNLLAALFLLLNTAFVVQQRQTKTFRFWISLYFLISYFVLKFFGEVFVQSDLRFAFSLTALSVLTVSFLPFLTGIFGGLIFRLKQKTPVSPGHWLARAGQIGTVGILTGFGIVLVGIFYVSIF